MTAAAKGEPEKRFRAAAIYIKAAAEAIAFEVPRVSVQRSKHDDYNKFQYGLVFYQTKKNSVSFYQPKAKPFLL
jgi:hypothetical protein